jgi:anti-anti-sigma factor
MIHQQIKQNDILIEVVTISRATLEVANEIKSILLDDISNGYRKIIVDLSECEYIDSTFLGAMVLALKSIISVGGILKLNGLQPKVESMFQMSSLDRVFDTFETREEAINSFNPSYLHR